MMSNSVKQLSYCFFVFCVVVLSSGYYYGK